MKREKIKGLKADFNDIKYIRIFFVILFFVITLLASWNCDDAYHGFVMSKNLAEGNGFVYNVGERVNASTCPLFSILIGCLGIVFKNYPIMSFFVCSLLSTAAFAVIVYRFCRKRWHVVFLFFALISSYSFFSYTTSGLENSLLFLLEALFLSIVLLNEKFDAKKLLGISFICSLILMTRMDAGIIVFFVTAYCFLAKRDCGFFKMILCGIAGLIPFALWEVFSVLYYGALFPNTYYIKVNTGFEKSLYIKNGIIYMFASEIFDVALAVFIIIAIILMIKSKNLKMVCITIGMVAKAAYLLSVGGDFMLGRHFSDMYFIAIIVIVFLEDSIKIPFSLFEADNRSILCCLLVFCLSLTVIFRSINVTDYISKDYFADEKQNYSSTQSFLRVVKNKVLYDYDITKAFWDTDEVNRSLESGVKGDILEWAPGAIVFYNNDGFYLNDKYGLGDPLLSHLPAVEMENFRSGHMYREVPEGYRESRQTGENKIVDPDLHEFYDIMTKVISDPFFDKDRIKLSVEFAMGKYDYLVDNYIENVGEAK